ncbi:TrkA domain protein [hydrothermal vent metagenome]|uniref:TrkA domain protein n=1 Tax=hydrothermal vent metagenome TaxID=652676 RepID=A0A1W1CAZ6_9ZZZZ
MKNILILANSEMAKHFVEWVGKSRIDNNHYYITCSNHLESIVKETDNLSFLIEDPTSYLKLKKIMSEIFFSTVFIVMNDREEAIYSYKNVRMLYSKLRIIFVSSWDDLELDDTYVKVLNVNELMASHLYEHLPNVPIIAKNIGLGRGEIMEVLVPFGSSYAYRHVGSVSHRKWRIVVIYRTGKQILPSSATVIKPNDRMVIVGNPTVLEGVYRRITRRKGLFPEPFGKNLYLIIDMDKSREDIVLQVNEAIFLLKQLSQSRLYIRVTHVISLELLDELREFETDTIQLLVNYQYDKLLNDIDYDTVYYDIGLFLIDSSLFKSTLQERLYLQKRSIYIFGEYPLYDITKAVILMGEEEAMESISSSVFDLSERLGLKLNLCNYDPEGDFSEKKNIIEHYESLSNLYSFHIDIVEKKSNPIVELRDADEILHIVPFNRSVLKKPIANFFSMKFSHYFLSIRKHPQLLIPVDE